MRTADNFLDSDFVDFICQMGPSIATPETTRTTDVVGSCSTCQTSIAAPRLLAGKRIGVQTCRNCDSWYVVRTEDNAKLKLNIVEQIPNNSWSHREQVPSNAVLEHLLGVHRRTGERRRDVRYPINVELVAAPANEDGSVYSDAISILLQNLSLRGFEAHIQQQVVPHCLILDFSNAGLDGYQAACKVVRHQTRHGYTKLGCEFMHYLGGPLPRSLIRR